MSLTYELLDSGGLEADWLSNWLKASHLGGRRRHQARALVREGLGPLGVTACALIAGPWLEGAEPPEGLWRLAPRPHGYPKERQRVAEGVGPLAPDREKEVGDGFLAQPGYQVPSRRPRAYRVSGSPAVVLVDPSLAGVRPGLVLLALEPGALLPSHPLVAVGTWWIAGLLRADRFRTHTERLGKVLAGDAGPRWGTGEHPVDAQEVVLRLSETVDRLAAGAAEAFEAATVSVFVPDPDDEYVWSLGTAGSEPHAYDAGLVQGRPPVPGVGFGLTASVSASPAWSPAGGPVVVRTLATRDDLRARYRDLGFEEESLDGGGDGAPFLGERFADPSQQEAVREGPWVFTAQRLPPALSPSGRNLVVRFVGRVLDPTWIADGQVRTTSRDRRGRMASLAVRIHGEVCRGLTEGLGLWREGMRAELLREMSGARRWPDICQALAARLSARVVSLFRVTGGSLELAAWSRPNPTPALRFDPEEELLAPRELRLLTTSICLPRDEITDEGFAGWSPFDEASGGPHANVGTFPVIAGDQPVGLLRVDGGMSLFGGLVRRDSRQRKLRHHRPRVLPAHLRTACEETAALIAVALAERGARAPKGDWALFVRRVRRGAIEGGEARVYLERVHARAPTRGEAAALVGVHRNTFRRHLAELAEVLGEHALPW